MGKRAADAALSALLIILFSPAFVLIPAASKLLAPGRPVLFRHLRHGRGGVPFLLVKFRTMDDGQEGEPGGFFGFLRRTGLDELPQLFQVLSGKMSLVGPRPLDVEEEEIHRMRERSGVYSLRPGLTGWAQINGGAALPDEAKAELDREYLEGRSWAADLLILAETALRALRPREAVEPGKVYVTICGTKGLPAAYGGFETLAAGLAGRRRDPSISYRVSGMGKKGERTVSGAACRDFSSILPGAAGRAACALKSLFWALGFRLRNPVGSQAVLVLGARAGIFLPLLCPLFRALGVPVIGHPDGFEERRGKWGRAEAAFVGASRRALERACDALVFDSEVVRREDGAALPSAVIAYGGEDTEGDREAYAAWLAENGLEAGGYVLMASRAVPENNHALAAEAFRDGPLPLVILSDSPERAGGGKNVLSLPGVWDPALLAEIRRGAAAVVHAHEAGGANPGLIEAMAQGCLILALDAPCNREVAGDGAVWFRKAPASLRGALRRGLEPGTRERTVRAALERAADFRWEDVVDSYESLFRTLAGQG